jgi:localization factor PodJL
VNQAAHWYQKAALAGSAPAQYRLATLFERGRGVPRDPATALVWYQRAAEQGNVKAMHNAAVIAAGTEAGKPDYDIAYKWFLAASHNGLKDSQFNLAVLYERGLGTKPNVDEALFWYLVAARQDDADAKRAGCFRKPLAGRRGNGKGRVKAWTATAAGKCQRRDDQDAAQRSSPSLTQIQSAQPAIARREAANDPVGLTQQLQNQQGFNIGKPDGKMYTRTANAIRLFQLQYGMKVTGEVTEALISKLQATQG